jgi:hypothetical protein
VLIFKDKNYSPWTDNKERRFEVCRVKEIHQVWSVIRRTIVISETPGEFTRTSGDINRSSASTTSPPTVGGIGGGLRIGWASTRAVGFDIRDDDTGVGNILNPLKNFRGIGRRGRVQRRIVGGYQKSGYYRERNSSTKANGGRIIRVTIG